ncbi:MAG: alpha/beta hydrolase [Candidatus Dormibacteraeota bacterium]|uniref:Alpha/beta hydrolase n=1 Tax=Candidatus Dormiibacter inghamiae TaxID=3127013 RepID=A0A934KF91_9BACT|nr:alpha/beta hydrolase [Candidatus Dormibacteraeota bacterium]MBJ7605571.1 alpha/beta hydrolase [Candidatus Dormibacteraeota bacterium]
MIRTLGGLAADDYGESDARPPLMLLHGLTFDRSLWRPTLAELRRIDPGRRVLAFDLPGHGESPEWSSYDVESVADGVHSAVQEGQLQAPVLVGHSIAAVIATLYAARHPTRGIVNVDQSLQFAPFAGLVQSLADKLRGPAFPAVWEQIAASMHIELLPESAQHLVRASCHPEQDLVLGYWREILERPHDEVADLATGGLASVRAAGVPYLVVAGSALEPDYEQWLKEMLPQATVIVWPGSGHFPHLAHPDRFAKCLAATARWPADAPSDARPRDDQAII